jgi:hypothetical protein
MSDARTVSREAQAAKMLLDSVHQHFCDDADAAFTVVEGETSLFEVIDEILIRLSEIDAHVDGIRAAGAKLAARSNRLQIQAERLTASLLLAMDTVGLKKLERPAATLSIAKVPDKAVITSEESLPSSFLVEKTEIKPDKKAILAALKEGQTIPGAELSNGGVTLKILRS